MSVFTTVSAAARRRAGGGLACLVLSGLLWGTGGLTGSLLSRAAGLPAISVAAYRLTVGGALIVVFLTVTGRPHSCRSQRLSAAWVSGPARGHRLDDRAGHGPGGSGLHLYFRGLRTAAASTAALMSLLEPLTGAVLPALILGDRLDITGMAGAAILAVAVMLTMRAHRWPVRRRIVLSWPPGPRRAASSATGRAPGIRARR
jgi:drug/metabolite transporter (DMT)-like permease